LKHKPLVLLPNGIISELPSGDELDIPAGVTFGESLLFPYCTIDQIKTSTPIDELAQMLIGRCGFGVDTQEGIATIYRAIFDGAGIINSYISKAYTLPLQNTPLVLTSINIDTALYRLLNVQNEAREKRYSEAIAHLEKLATGKLSLEPVTQAVSPPPKPQSVFFEFTPRVN
jgi:phage gp36-like protein